MKKPKHIGVRFVLAWIFGVLFILEGALSLLDSLIGGLLIILGAAIILPPFGDFIEKKYHYHLSGWLKLILFLLLVGIGSLLILTNEESSDFIEEQETSGETKQTFPEQQLSDVGDFRVEYAPTTNPTYMGYEQVFKESRLFEGMTDVLNSMFILPKNIPVILSECGSPNAYYDTGKIIMCYELVDQLAETFNLKELSEEEYGKGIINTEIFIFYHEVGHALIDVLNLPITGREEDVADQFATVLLAEGDYEEGALDGAAFFLLYAQNTNLEDLAFWDEHSLDEQRFYNIICWIYGHNPEKYNSLAQSYLPESRTERCPQEYQQISTSWDKITKDYVKESPYASLQQPSQPQPPIPSYVCDSDYYNCIDFDDRVNAQKAFDTCFASSGDIHKLDNDGDGQACESLN